MSNPDRHRGLDSTGHRPGLHTPAYVAPTEPSRHPRMRCRRRPWRTRPVPIVAPLVALSLLALPRLAGAQEEAPDPAGWTGTGEATFVFTGGNTDASSLGFRLAIGRAWSGGKVSLEGGGIRVRTGTRTRSAVGSPDDFSVVEDTTSSVTAENYYSRARFDRPISDRFEWHLGAGWERNLFGGIASRYTVSGGLGRVWVDDDGSRLRTDLGLTYTRENFVAAVQGAQFGGLRFSSDYSRKLGEATTFTSKLIADESLADTADLRADFLNSLAVAMSDRLALKVSLQVLWDNRPALVGVPLVSADGTLSGSTVLAPLGKTDSLLTLALVINF